MEFDTTTTAVVFAALIALGTGGLVFAPFMGTRTVLMMVMPSMAAFGLVCLWIGVKHGEYRASDRL